LGIVTGCGDEPWGPWTTSLVLLNFTAEGTDLFFILWRRRVEWRGTSLVALLVMCSAVENRRKCNYSKNSAASGQNEQINSKKWVFALLLLTDPLPLTILNNVSMKIVAIGGPLSLTI
jgi:hypothetical protein